MRTIVELHIIQDYSTEKEQLLLARECDFSFTPIAGMFLRFEPTSDRSKGDELSKLRRECNVCPKVDLEINLVRYNVDLDHFQVLCHHVASGAENMECLARQYVLDYDFVRQTYHGYFPEAAMRAFHPSRRLPASEPSKSDPQ